jgi:predicted naringenin-chalcone synthase
VQHNQVAVQVTVVSDDLPNVVRAGLSNDHKIAGVVERLHADPVRDHVAHPSGENGTRAKEDQ